MVKLGGRLFGIVKPGRSKTTKSKLLYSNSPALGTFGAGQVLIDSIKSAPNTNLWEGELMLSMSSEREMAFIAGDHARARSKRAKYH